jgi:hypothetical protein
LRALLDAFEHEAELVAADARERVARAGRESCAAGMTVPPGVRPGATSATWLPLFR